MPVACISCSSDTSSEVEKLNKPIETLSSQIKHMALKALGAYCQCTPCRRKPAELQRRDGSFSTGVELDDYMRSKCGSTAGEKELEGRVEGISGSEWMPAVANGRRVNPVVFVEESEPKEWVAQVERGVLITFVSLPGGCNDLKRIRFREMFDKLKAERWWAENSENMMELYNVKRQTLLLDYSMQSPSISNLCGIPSTQTSLPPDVESEWVERDEPGVYITIRALPDGRRELRRIRFRREKFGETEARLWWEENRERISKQYYL